MVKKKEDKHDVLFKTFNSYDEEDQKVLLNNFINSNSIILKKHLGYLGISKLQRSFGILSILLLGGKKEEINIISRFLHETKFKFSNGNIKIPAQLNLISEIIFSKKFDKKGLFRINTTKKKMKIATSILYDIVECRLGPETGRVLFSKNFDLIDCCELYKELLRTFNTTVIPQGYIDLILKTTNIKDINEKILCIKAIIYSLPKINGMILESNIYICCKICEITGNLENKKQQLKLDGLAIVMMPNLFLLNDNDIEIEKVFELVKFTKFLYKNFQSIIKIEPTYL